MPWIEKIEHKAVNMDASKHPTFKSNLTKKTTSMEQRNVHIEQSPHN